MADPIWCIQGGGLAGWGAAAMLSRSLPQSHSIVVCDEDPDVTADAMETALVSADGPLVQLAEADDRLMIEADGVFCLGAIFRVWAKGKDLAVSEQQPLPSIDGVAIQDIVLRAAKQLSPQHSYANLLAPLQFQARAMAAERYAHPSPDRQSPRSLLKPQLMLDGHALARRLESAARRRGVQSTRGLAGIDPFITIDTQPATAFVGDEDWRARLGYDRSLIMRYRGEGLPSPYIDTRRLPSGLLTRTSLATGGVLTLCYSSSQTTSEQARAAVERMADEVDITQGCDSAFTPGLRRAPWVRERIALGAASARLGPALGLDAVLLDRQLGLLAGHLPKDADQIAACAAAYNHAVVQDAAHRADRLHLILSQGPQGSGLAPASPVLERRLRQFSSRNRPVALDGDPYDSQHWVMLMAALGDTPRRYDVQADRLDLPKAMAAVGRMVMAFDQTLAAMPPHTTALDGLRRK